MGVNYSLDKVKELASGDTDFIVAIATAFLDEVPEAIAQIENGIQSSNYAKVYQNAHKIKPTIQLFDIPIFEDVITVQDWGKHEQSDKNICTEFEHIDAVIKQVSAELKAKFEL